MIELLTIIAIMAAMVAVSVVSVRAGQTAARTKGAARDVFALIRHARSSALITQQPAIITYSNEQTDGEACAKVTVTGAKITGEGSGKGAETLSGKKLKGAEGEGELEEGGVKVEEVLFAPISEDVVKGMRIKVLKAGESLDGSEGEDKAKPKISVFSNVDYLLGKFAERRRAKRRSGKGTRKRSRRRTMRCRGRFRWCGRRTGARSRTRFTCTRTGRSRKRACA